MFFFVQSFMAYGPGMLVGFFFGMACGAVVLTWLVNRSGSILLVALWHGTYNIVSGTAGADGTVQVVVSSLVEDIAPWLPGDVGDAPHVLRYGPRSPSARQPASGVRHTRTTMPLS